MASLNMEGPFDLNNATVDNEVTKKSAGNYALGYEKEDAFYVRYVGRADSNLNERLKQHIGEKYKKFKYSYATSPKDAFEKECKNYHDFGGLEGKLDNKMHPDSPSGISRKCPYCK